MASREKLTALGMRTVGRGVKAAPKGPTSLGNAPVWGILTPDSSSWGCGAFFRDRPLFCFVVFFRTLSTNGIDPWVRAPCFLFSFGFFLIMILTREYAYCVMRTFRTYLYARIALLTCSDFLALVVLIFNPSNGRF